MAALTMAAARAAREDAQRLRADCAELTLAVRATARITRARTSTAVTAVAAVRARCAVPLNSPWSGLVWLRDDEELGRALVPLD